ncbi:hypothetical protein F5X68DRAFT_235657 [Plectosphaerella plurivora]|uniref:DUF6536 domain-containing protein n=1 Tax=Plectosphaerella plurivora TaxID=936078 RepID=A0A9P8V4P6_9PEZI|nr:hypothetical protein F5X68DRAFT_235657 [Plectosphaerella plurivora]
MTPEPTVSRRRLSGLRLSGWRKTAAINTVVILVIFLGLAGSLAWALYLSGGLNRVLILYQGSCEKSRDINLVLHLGSNILSTGILASSNFFLQILTSPSREEIDLAHANSQSLDIGVQSLMNFSRLRKRKVITWILLVLGSLPLHVFANSVFFRTDDGRIDYHAIYATESFVHGGPYFRPGAALEPPLSYYSSNKGPTHYINEIVSKARKEAAGWERIDAKACAARYGDRKPLHDYRDVVMILDSNGWTIEDLWNPNSPRAGIRLPKADLNTLLSIQPGATLGSTFSVNSIRLPKFLSIQQRRDGSSTLLVALHPSKLSYQGQSLTEVEISTVFSDKVMLEFDDSIPSYRVLYCLSEPLRGNCKVAMSLSVLLIVVVTTLVKLSQLFQVYHGQNGFQEEP